MNLRFSVKSGGQTGVDQAALKVAKELKKEMRDLGIDVDYSGWCPRGRRSDDINGTIPEEYDQLKCPDGPSEVKEEDIFRERTKLNIRDSDGTLLLYPEVPLPENIQDGTRLTREYVEETRKPFLVINLSRINDPNEVFTWVNKYNIKTLNIAGPKESQWPGIHEQSLQYLKKTLRFVLTKQANLKDEKTSKNRSCPSCFIM